MHFEISFLTRYYDAAHLRDQWR